MCQCILWATKLESSFSEKDMQVTKAALGEVEQHDLSLLLNSGVVTPGALCSIQAPLYKTDTDILERESEKWLGRCLRDQTISLMRKG